MKTTSAKARTTIKATIIILITVSYILNWGIGTLSAPGIGDISVLCPLGALTTMITTKTIIPRAVVSLVLITIAIILFARAFCSWICPIPLVSNIRNVFTNKQKAKKSKSQDDVAYEKILRVTAPSKGHVKPLTQEEINQLSLACKPQKGKFFDSRYWVLVVAIVSTLIFGWPVFCLICPIGLTFASIFLVINLFATGDVTWSVIVIPLILGIEVIFFRKWCQTLCPLSACMSLVGKANKTFTPTIDDSACRETAKNQRCGICSRVCPEKINPRNPKLSFSDWSECTKCRACVDSCPEHAISLPIISRRQKTQKQKTETSQS